MLLDICFTKKTSQETQTFELIKSQETPLIWQGESINFIDPINIKGIIKKAEAGSIIAQGNFATKIQVQCSRCLKAFQTEFYGDFEGEFIPSGVAAEEKMEEDFPGQFYSGDTLDITGLIQEGITFALPMQFLCMENCLGLCAYCGVRMDEENCNCEKKQIDPRLEVLKKLLKGSNSERRGSDGSTTKETIKIKKK